MLFFVLFQSYGNLTEEQLKMNILTKRIKALQSFDIP